MDLGTALAVTSLMIQLGETITKLYSLLRSIQDAPDYINSILQDLDFIRFTLAQIASHQEKFGQDPGTELVLEKCWEPLHALELIAYSVVPGLKSDSKIKRKWAAIEVVWRQEDITKFRKKLQGAKLELLLVFQISSARTLHLQNELNHESVLRIMKEAFSAQDPYLVGPQYLSSDSQTEYRAKAISQEILQSSVIHLYDSLQTELKKELRLVIQDTLASVLQDMHRCEKMDNPPDAPASTVGEFGHRSKRRRNWMEVRTVSRTIFGDIHCSKTVPRIIPADDEESDVVEYSPLVKKKEVALNFVPSWWLIKLGLSRAMQISTWGWQANIRMPKVRPRTSLIFEFCREGNISAVTRMISSGEASIDNMTEYGETLLHFAAGYCHADLCSLFLDHGADRDARDFIRRARPFDFVFGPGEAVPVSPEPWRRWQFVTSQPSNSQVVATMREFLRRGQDLEDTFYCNFILFLLIWGNSDGHQTRTEIDPSDWLLWDAIPALGIRDIDSGWWEQLLGVSIFLPFEHVKLLRIIKHCRSQGIKSAFLGLISGYSYDMEINDYQQRFDILAEHSGGVCFLLDYHYPGHKLSPLSSAMNHSWSFSRFRTWLRKSRWTPIDAFENETELERLGWMEDTVLSLFNEDVIPWTQEFPECDEGFRNCRYCIPQPISLDHFWNYPWSKKLRRIRDNIPISSPLRGEEILREAAWLAAKQAEASKICFECFCQRNQKKWPFLLDIIRGWCLE